MVAAQVRFLIALALAGPCSLVLAQETPLPDPTLESPAIQSQLEAIRGVEQLEALQKQIEQLVQQNSQLMKQLAETAQRTESLETELAGVRESRQAIEAQKRAVPEMRLVAQLRTATMRQAEIEAADRVYRVSDAQAFPLVLTDGQVVTAEVSFLEDGKVQISLPDLSAVQVLAFRPTAVEPASRPALPAPRRGSVED